MLDLAPDQVHIPTQAVADGRSTSARLRDAEAERDRLREFVALVAQLDDPDSPANHLVTWSGVAAAAREVLR